MNGQREVRIHTSVLAAVEKRCLIWMAHRLPAGINSDHLTTLAAFAMLAAGLCYWLAPASPPALWGAVLMLCVNWFGDSLDGTLARVRHHERPRYGFYVDHVLDAVGILFLIGGLVLGGFMSPMIGAAFLISYWKFGPTELRILLAAGTIQLLRSPDVSVFGVRLLLFDIGGAIAAAGLLATFVISAVRNTRTLYRAEPLPRTAKPGIELRTDVAPGLQARPGGV